jgi:hypothetical protein
VIHLCFSFGTFISIEDTFGFWFGYFIYLGVLLQHFVLVHCSSYVHVDVLYLDTRCCDDIHEVTPARFHCGGV